MKYSIVLLLSIISLHSAEMPADIQGKYKIYKTDIQFNGKIIAIKQADVSGTFNFDKNSISYKLLVGNYENAKTINVSEFTKNDDGIQYIDSNNRVNIVVIVDKDHLIFKVGKLPDGKSVDDLEILYLERDP